MEAVRGRVRAFLLRYRDRIPALGMLTLGTAPRDFLGYDLEIPNRVIRELLVFVGAKKVLFRPWEGGAKRAAPKRRRRDRG